MYTFDGGFIVWEYLLDVNAIDEKVGLEHILLSNLSVIKKTNFGNYITKDVMTSLLDVPNIRHWNTFGMHVKLAPSLMLHINWIISNI